MAKKKSSFLRNLQRSRKTTSKTLRVESLESRQLYASISGAGQEVVTDQTNSDGVTYDQILMTGASVSVSNDVGQVTRVSFLDNDGDIVQVALIGSGTLNVSLDNPVTNVAPSNYNAAAQAYSYTQGNATITITGSDASTSMEVYSVGAARNGGVVDATHQGGDHWADISRIIIVGNEKNEAGYTNFGSIRAGNAYFSADTGVVGIRAENVAVQGAVRIGDIDATGSGVPTLYFNSNSQFQTVFVQGGDLEQSNGTSFNSFGNGNAGGTGNDSSAGGVSLGGFAYFNSVWGQDSQGNFLMPTPVNQDAIRLAAVDQTTAMCSLSDALSGKSSSQYTPSIWEFTLDVAGNVIAATQDGSDVLSALLQGATGAQNTLDAAFAGRTFIGSININGDLPAGFEINVADVRDSLATAALEGNVTFANNLFGSFVVDGHGASIDGTLTVMGDLDGHVLVRGLDRVAIATNAMLAQNEATYNVGDAQINKINAIVVEGSTGEFADVRAEEIGNVLVRNDFSGVLSTNVWSEDASNGNLALPNVGGIDWNSTSRTATGYVDFDGKIGNITIGKSDEGTSNGGSIINGTIQGMSGIGNVWVGGDVWGSAPGQAVFVTSSNIGAAATDVRNYGTASIGDITIHGDVDLDATDDCLIYIAGNGKFGDITVEGQVTYDLVEGEKLSPPDITFVPIEGTETFVRVLSLKEAGGAFVADPAAGQVLIYNVDINGDAAGGLDYIVTAQDLVDNPALQVYSLTDGKLVAAKVGDKVPVLDSVGVPAKDTFGNVVYTQNTALYQAEMEEVEEWHYGPATLEILSGNRGNLDGVANNFGRIQIGRVMDGENVGGLLGAQNVSTGTISWNDSVDMNFGGITLNSANNQGVIASAGTIGQITIVNDGLGVASIVKTGTDADGNDILAVAYQDLEGAKADLDLSGRIGSAELAAGGTNGTTAFVALDGLEIGGFEDVEFGRIEDVEFGRIDIDGQVAANNNIIHVTQINAGIEIETIDGVGNGTGAGTVSPSVTFNSRILLNDGTTEYDNQDALLKINADAVNSTNSTIFFAADAGIVVDNGGTTGQIGSISNLSLKADVVDFRGLLSAQTIGDITIVGGSGIGSNADRAVNFTGTITADTVGDINISASEGNIVFSPAGISASSDLDVATVGDITLSTAGTNNGGDISFGQNGKTYDADFGDIKLTAGHKLFLDQAGAIVDNSGDITIAVTTTGNVGNIEATTTSGDINNNLTIMGDVGNITYTAGVAVVADSDDYAGTAGDIVRAGDIDAKQTIWGTRGQTIMTTAGSDGSTIDFTVAGVDYSFLANGTINATLDYAGASTATGNAFIAKTGAGNATINYNVIGHDDNNDGVISRTEIGHGGSVDVSSVEGNIDFTATSTVGLAVDGSVALPLFTHFNTLGNVVLATGEEGTIDLAFTGGANGFEGMVGSITATSAKGYTDLGASEFANSVGAIALESTDGGDVNANAIFNGNRNTVTLTTHGAGDINATLESNGKTTATDASFVFSTEQGDQDITLKAGSFDANNNGRTTADEYASVGNIEASSMGGDIELTLADGNGPAYTSAKFGTITLTNTTQVEPVFGLPDFAADAALKGNITISGGNYTGVVGDITASLVTDAAAPEFGGIGTITVTGSFGDVGKMTLDTASYSDPDTKVNVDDEKPVFLRAGTIDFDNLTIERGHDTIKATTIENGAVTGGITFGGASTSELGLDVKTALGDVNLDATVKGAGQSGDMAINSDAGDIGLTLDTVISSGSYNKVAAFGDITLKTGHAYKGEYYTDDIVRDYFTGSKSADKDDETNMIGTIKVTGAAENFGTVGDIKADTTQGDITLIGDFFNVGNVDLKTTAYADTVETAMELDAKLDGTTAYADTVETVKNAYAGNIILGDEVLTINGTHGTMTLTTYVDVQTDSGTTGGTVNGGDISGVIVFGGSHTTGQKSIVATTGSSDIDLEVTAKWFDLNNNGLISDEVNQQVQGEYVNEFANVGDIELISNAKSGMLKAEAGDITLKIATGTEDDSTVGSVIGNIYAETTTVVQGAAADDVTDDIDSGEVKITGTTPAAQLTAGEIGDIEIKVGAGLATLTGNFHNVGELKITTDSYTDESNDDGDAELLASGNIKLGTQAYGPNQDADLGGFTSLNIAGTYETSSFSVAEKGELTGSVYIAGDSGNDWSLTAEHGKIDVGFVAGFDADGRDTTGKLPADAGYDATKAIGANEAGKIGNITATSNHSNVTIAVGGRAATSIIGDVSVSTGDVVVEQANKADDITSYNVTIQGISGMGLGSVGNLTATVETGVANLAGTFGGIGNATYTTGVVIDLDPTAAATENRIVAKAGDIVLNAEVWGSHGTLNLTTIDSSSVAAINDVTALVAPQTSVETLNKVAGAVGELGNITGNIAFSGGLNSGVTDGIVAKTDRGEITLTITSGIDEDGGTDQDSNEAGAVGNVSFTSIDGDLTANLNIRNSVSSIGNVTLTTGATFNTNEELADAQIAAGDATITSNNVGANGNYGTIGNIAVNTTVGDITFNGVYNNLGTVTLDAGRQTDADTVAGSGEPLAILDAGDITVNTTIHGASGMFTLDTDDNATAGAAAGVTGDITATIVVDGTLTNGVLATTDQGTINATITAGTSVKLVDAIANVTADDATKNSDDRVGAVGNVVLTSVYGDITSTNNTAVVAIVPASTDAIRYSSIGNVTATTGGSWAAQAALNDTLVIDGDITFAGTSNGTIGNIAGTTSTGDITFGGTYNHTVGNITLTGGFYTDTDPAVAGVDILGAGSIAFGGAFANNAAITTNTVGNITLSASGAISNAGDQTGNITVTRSIGGAWTDAGVIGDIEAGEQVTYDDGAFLATVVDGTITFNETADATGFGAKFDNVTLKSTGGSNEAGTGNITVGGGGSYSQVSNVLVEAATGDVTFAGAYVAPTISSVTLYSKAGNGVSGNGSVDFQAAGKLDLGFQNAIDNRAVNVSTSNVTIKADNGNVTVAGSIGEQLTYTATNYAVAGGVVTDARTATISGITLTANNGLVNDGAADGALLISGEIGGEDITRIADITAGAGNVAGDGTTISGSVNAHDIGTLAFTGNLNLTVAGAISASDAATTRQYIGAIDYTAMTTGAAANKGSLLDIIDSITVTNGSVTGAAGVTYVGNNRGEIEASKITAISFINNVNPSVGPAYTVQDLDVLASNSRGGISQGEFLNVNGVAAADAASAITAFGLGNVTIQFNVTNTDDAGGLFAGNSAFVGLGGIGNIALTTSTNGAVPRPMFAAAAGAGVRFAAGTGIAYGATFDTDGDTGTAAVAYDDVAAAGVGDKISVGDIYVKVGRSLPANIADPLMLNIGGDNTVTTDGFGVLVAAQAPAAADTAAARVAAATELYGYIKSVDVSTTSTRVDADGTQFVATAGAALPAAPLAGTADAGAFIAVAGDATAAHDIGNLDNDFVPNGDAPVDDTQGFILGDTDTAYDEGEVVVYVL